jgi:flagellar biosynthesis GTPase FlhF
VVNEVLSEIASENREMYQDNSNQHSEANAQSQKVHSVLMQQQMMLQQLQHQLYNQQNQSQESTLPSSSSEVLKEEPMYTKVSNDIQKIMTSENNLIIKSAIMYLVFQYIDVLVIIMGSAKLLKIDGFFSLLETNSVLANLVKSVVFSVLLILIHSLI